MSERAIFSLLVACTVLAAPLRAQDLAQLKRREAELTARRDELQSRLGLEAEQRFQSQPRTVLSVGGLHVAYPDRAATGGSERLTQALGDQMRRYGTAVDSFLTDTLYMGIEGVSGSATVTYRMGAEDGSQVVAIDPVHPGDWVAGLAGAALQQWALTLLDGSLKRWLGALDQRTTVATLRDPIVRDLVVSPSSRAHRCLNGAPDDCRLLLELDAGATPLLEAYDRSDLPGLFARMDLNDRIPGRANCTGKRDPAACAELVRLGRALPPHPVSTRARQSLFAYAVASGGEGAWLRLHRASGRPVAEQLSIAAGLPVDSLLTAWQHDLIAGRRTTTAGLIPSLVLALIWSAVGTLFFAWRYRWRHV